MDFTPSPRVVELKQRIVEFLDEHVYPREMELLHDEHEVRAGVPYPRKIVEIREKAKARGLWNLFLPGKHGAGLTNWEYGILCEEMGRSLIGAMAFNCHAPDTGNIEILEEFGTPDQQRQWLKPLLDGDIRSCFSMTEPDVAGSDPTLIQTRAVKDGDHWVINGHKWFTSGAVGAGVAIVMAVSDPEAAPHLRASMILVPTDAKGFNLIRPVSVMGHTAGGGHCEIRYEDCRVPITSTLGPEGGGFMIAQARLGPGRIHHCMRAIGAAERAIEMMCKRANTRVAFGEPLAKKQFVQDMIATSRMEVDQARLMTLYAAWKMDAVGKREARQEISMIKVIAANVVMQVLDRAIQVHGALGVTDDTPLAHFYRHERGARIYDGADEVHKVVVAKRVLKRHGLEVT